MAGPMKRLCLAVLVLGILGSSLPPASAAFPGGNGRIVSFSLIDGEDFIRTYWSVLPDGSGSERTAIRGNSVRWSPDGERVVYAVRSDTGHSLHVANADGSEASQVWDEWVSNHPTWSPDGSAIAFSTINSRGFNGWGSSWGIRVLDVETLETFEVTSPSAGFDMRPTWSPDGARIAFVRCSEFGPQWPPGDRGWSPDFRTGCQDAPDLFVVDVDGSNLLQLTNTATSESDPDWSPDGRKLIFTCNEPTPATPNGKGGICLLNLRSDRSRTIYKNRAVSEAPVWSPNGRRIAFVLYPRNEENFDSEIYTIRPDGTGLRRVTDNRRDEYRPQWLAR